MIYAYARVSSIDQNLSRQFDAFKQFGIKPCNVYSDKRSGKDFERQNYGKLLKKLKKDDLLVIKSIDRLGRNYDAIINEWYKITNRLECDILVLDMPLLDTRTKDSTLVGKFISDIVLQVLSFVAENERVNIRLRQAEGIRLAKIQGKQFGRPPKEYTQEFIDIAIRYKQRSVSAEDALIKLNTSKSNFHHHLRKLNDLGYFNRR